MKYLTWNLEWASPSSKRGKLLKEIISVTNHSVACFTEIKQDFIPYGEIITSHNDYGYSNSEGKRKVILGSKSPWEKVDIKPIYGI